MFRHDDLEALIRKHPDIRLRLLAPVSARLSDTEHRLSSLTSRNVEGRLADYLIGLPAPDGAALPPRTSRWPRRTCLLLDTTPELQPRPEELARAGLIVIGEGRSGYCRVIVGAVMPAPRWANRRRNAAASRSRVSAQCACHIRGPGHSWWGRARPWATGAASWLVTSLLDSTHGSA